MGNKIILKNSSVAAKVPQSGDLEYGELALNYKDGKLWYKNDSNVITQLNTGLTGTVPVANGGTGLTSIAALSVPVANTANTYTTVTASANQSIRVNAGGTAWEAYTPAAGGSGTVTSVAATVPSFLSISGSPITTSGTLAITYSGTALPVLNGGTGQTTVQAAINSLAGAVTSGQYLRGNGANVVMSAIQSADVPTLNQNTTGSAATLTTARTINGSSFNGSANIVVPLLYDENYRRITNPGGAEYVTSTASVTGAIAITLPVGMTSTMVRMTIKVYEYITNRSFEINCGGYTYPPSNTWANNPFAYIVGNPSVDRRFTVRFGYDSTSTKAVIYIGELASTWSYPQVFVTDVQLGFSGNSISWTTGWSIGFESTAFQNVTATITNSQVGYATSTNTADAIVLRDGSGNFSAGTITANLSGNATNVTGTVGVANGGTGANTLTGILKGNGTSAVVAATAGTDYVTPTGVETLTNKTIDTLTLNKGYIEQVFALGTSGSISLNPTNGSIQTCALTGNPTFTDSLSAGQSIVLMLTNGASYVVGWPTITWVTSAGNVAPTLTAANTFVFWKVSTTLYGAVVGSYA